MFPGYRGEQLVGEGGLGRVYRAVRESTGGVVAIKELREVPTASPAWHRARRELEAMLRLKGHPFVVSVEELIDGPAGPCIVMEYLEGGSLMGRLAHGHLAVPELILVGQHSTQALGAAHDVGIVHRDVKPHNLLIGSFGQIKVADFGIAALTRDAGLRTQTHAFTLAYASPEELDGEAEVGPAADVFSFAATMSHLATGVKPSFSDRTVAGGLDAVARRHAVMDAVVADLRRCLLTDPSQRPTMRQLQHLFDSATTRLGERRITRLGPPGSVVDRPADAVAIAPPPVVHPPPAVFQLPPIIVAPPPTPTIAHPTVIRPVTPQSAEVPTAPLVSTADWPVAARADPRGSSRHGWIIAALAIVAAGAVAGAAALVYGRDDGGEKVASAGPVAAASSSTETTNDPARAATTSAAAAATSVAPETTTTLAPTTTVAPTTTLAPTTTFAPTTTVAETAPPTVTPAPQPPTFSETDATVAFTQYIGLAAQRLYPEAWARLTPRYQAKYKSYDVFVKFWETVDGAGLRSANSIGTFANGHSLRCYMWYGRREDGTVANEIVEVDLIADPSTGAILIDDYRYQGVG